MKALGRPMDLTRSCDQVPGSACIRNESAIIDLHPSPQPLQTGARSDY